MLREMAISIVKEIAKSCKLLNPKSINLELSADRHYEIRIESDFDDESWESLKAIAKKYSLGVKLTDNILIIYQTEK